MWDCEEFVIPTCINAMSSLIELGLLKKHDTFDLLRDSCPYLLHPNIWIRQAAVGEPVVKDSIVVKDAFDISRFLSQAWSARAPAPSKTLTCG